jgi:nucleoside-diphosphate-sugar epimerase
VAAAVVTQDVALRYAGRRVLVTGGTGFLGRHLLCALVGAGAKVHVVVRSAHLDALPPGVEAHQGNLEDRASLVRAVSGADPDCVFHLAAYGTTGAQRDAMLMLRTNVEGTEHLWSAIEGRACRLVQTGTCAEYGSVRGPISETHVCAPRYRYPATMHAAVTLSIAHGFERGREVVILRPFGPFGPHDRPERLIPYVVRRLLDGQRAAVTAGQQLRDYSYVNDHVDAMLRAGALPLPRSVAVYNVASGEPVTVRRLLELVAAEIDRDAMGLIDFDARPLAQHEPAEMYADISAIAHDLGFAPRTPLRVGIQRTVAAYRAERWPR